MTMSSTRNVLLAWALLTFFVLHGQENLVGYWEPEMALNYKVGKNYAHNFSMDTRQYLYEGNDLQLRARHVDISHFSKLTIASQKSIALGIMYRFREALESMGQNELRLTQQYNIAQNLGKIRLGNRFRTEQRINPDRTIYRFRYRFALDLPLQGEKLNVGESYLVTSTESLLSAAQGSRPEWDQRGTAFIGWLLYPNTRFQTGMEYRTENYAQRAEHVLFLLTSLIFSL
ncbi:MAG: DUF2490 domain-containing protein [Bacteroidota bacterium]